MRPILYPPGTTDFTNLGVGKLRDTISAEVYEARNGAFTLEVEYPVNGVYFDQIKEFSYIKAKPNDRDDYHTFMVYEVTKSTTSRSVIVLATTKTDEIGNTLVTMTNTGNPQTLLNAMKTKALDPISYNMYSDISASKKVDWLRRNPLNAIVGESGSLVDLFGGELKRTDSTIFLYQRRGNDKVAKFTARRGLKGAKIVLSTASIVTRILPYITILGGAEEEDVTLTGTIVNSPLVNNYPVRPLVPVDFGMIDDSIDTLAKLNSKAATYFTSLYPEIDKPKVSIDLDLLSLQDTSDYAQFKAVEKIELCDTIDVYLPKYDVVRTVKVTELYYDSLREINTRIVAGDKSVSQIDAFKKEYNGQVNSIKDHLSKVENTMMVKGDGTQIWSGPDTPPPDKVNINDIWWKKTGEDTWALLIWNGLIWEDMLSDEIFKEIDIRIDQAETDIAQNVLDIESTLAKATQAEQDAGFSKDLAEEAKALGVTASSLADEAKTNANTAMADALEAIRQVELNEGVVADSSADSAEARRLAGLAEANAQEAKTNAGTAIADAEEALRQVGLNGAEATEAKRLAGLAETNAQEALTKANASVTDSSKALTDATKAFNKSFKSSTVAYATSTNGSTPPTTGWGTTVPSPSPDVYIWTRTTIVLNDNTPVVSYSVGKIGAKGDQGLKGDAGGQGIQGVPGANAPTITSVVQQFYLSTSNSTQTGGSWLATVPVWSSGKYYWRRVVTTYSNNATSTSTPVLDNALNDSLITALEVKTANQTLSTTVIQHATLIESKANSSTVDSLTGRVSTAEGSISTIAGEVALKASTTDLNTLTGRVSTAEGTITAQAGQIALRATTATVNTLTGRVSTAEGKITTQAGLIELKASTEDVNTLTGRVTTAEGAITVQAGQIASKVSQTDFNALNGRVGTAESTITQQAGEIALRVTTTTYNAGIGSKENTITKATTAPAHLNGRLWLDTSVTPNVLKRSTGTAWVKVTPTTPGEVGAYSAGDGSALAGRVTTAETSITSNTTAINLRATKTDLDATKGRVTTAEGAIQVQAGQIALKASQTSVDSLTGRVGTAETNISANSTAINLRATKTSVDSLTGRVTTAEGSITTQAGQIALRATTATVNALTGRVSTAETNITTNTTAINLRATKTELTTAIDGVQVGGRNLIIDSHFDGGNATGWYPGYGTHVVEEGIYKKTFTSLSSAARLERDFTNLEVGEHTFTIFAKTPLNLAWRAFIGTDEVNIVQTASPDAFKRYSVTFNVRTAGDVKVRAYVPNIPVGSVIEIDWEKLEKGNKATDWSPAPEDVDASIASVQSNLTVEAGKITALTTRVSGSETNITNVTQTVSGINTTISTLRTDVNGKATIVSLNEVKSTADGNKTTISNHSGRLTTVETNINGLQTTVSDKADKTTVTQLSTSIELKATKTDVDALTGRVSTAEGKITTQAGQIDLKANTTTVNTLTGRVATAEGNITTQAGLIALKANQSTVDTLTGRVSTTESKITATDGKVTTLTTKTDGHTTSIGQLQTSYSGLNSTVTQVKNNLEGMEIGGRNLIISKDIVPGLYLLEGTGSVSSASSHAITGFMETTPLTNYILSGDKGVIQIRFVAYDAQKNYISGVLYGGDRGTSQIYQTPANTAYIRVSADFKTLTHYSRWKLEKGNKATDWTPAPEDYTTVTAFSALEQNLSGFKTTVQNTYADKTTVNQLAGQWQTTTTLANGHTSQISSLGTQINLRATKTEVDDKILADKKIKDTRSTNQLPPWYYTNYPKQKAYEFKQCTTIGLPTSAGTYASVVTEVPWDGVSGGTVEQTATAGDGVYTRRGTSTWSAWAKVADSSNIISQINISPESILIASKKIQIKGDTYIDNGVIKTAHIADLAVSGAKIANASIASAKIISLDASKINVGTLTGHTINGAVINGGSITGTTFHNEGTDGNVAIANGRIRAKDFFVRENGALVSETGYIVVRSMLDYVFLQSNSEARVTSVRSYDEFMPMRASTFIAMSHFYSHGAYQGSNNTYYQSNNGWVSVRALSGDIYLQGGAVLVVDGGAGQSYKNIYANAFIGRGGNTAFGTDTGYSVLRSSGDTQPVYIQGSEIRATKVSTAGTYVAVRASAFPTGSMEEFKTDIKEYTNSALSIIRNATIYDYKLKSELESGRLKTRIGLVIGNGYHTPSEIIDGDGVEQYAMNSLGWKAIQELDVIATRASKVADEVNFKVIKLVANDSIYGLRLNNLESEVFRLKKRIEELEKIA